jgi:hypothetical protein
VGDGTPGTAKSVLTCPRRKRKRIAGALVVKHRGVFFLCRADGQIPVGGAHGFGLYYHDCRFLNYGVETVAFPVSLAFSSRFESVFTVRGLAPGKRGVLHAPAWQQGCLRFRYDGADGIHRALTVSFSPTPRSIDGARAEFDLKIAAGETAHLSVIFAIDESRNVNDIKKEWREPPDALKAHARKQAASDHAVGSQTTVRTDSRLLAEVVERSLRDLHMLENHDHELLYCSAGAIARSGSTTCSSLLWPCRKTTNRVASSPRTLARHCGPAALTRRRPGRP